MVRFRFAVSSEDGIQKLKDSIIKVESPSWMVIKFKHLDDGFYGDVFRDTFWIQWYDNSVWQGRTPKRYFKGKIVSNGKDIIIEGNFYLAFLYILLDVFVLAFMLIGGMYFGLIRTFLRAVVLILSVCAVLCCDKIIGIAIHKKYEKAVIDFLSSL